MTKLLNEIAYVLDSYKTTAVTGLEPEKVIELLNKHKRYKYLLITPNLIPYTQKDNCFWYERNLVERFLVGDFGVYLPDKEAPLLIRGYRRQLTFLVAPTFLLAPDGGKNANNYGRK